MRIQSNTTCTPCVRCWTFFVAAFLFFSDSFNVALPILLGFVLIQSDTNDYKTQLLVHFGMSYIVLFCFDGVLTNRMYSCLSDVIKDGQFTPGVSRFIYVEAVFRKSHIAWLILLNVLELFFSAYSLVITIHQVSQPAPQNPVLNTTSSSTCPPSSDCNPFTITRLVAIWIYVLMCIEAILSLSVEITKASGIYQFLTGYFQFHQEWARIVVEQEVKDEYYVWVTFHK